MFSHPLCIILARITAPLLAVANVATAEPASSVIELRQSPFQSGKFAEAGKIYAQEAPGSPKDYAALPAGPHRAPLQPARHDAQGWLERAIALHPTTPTPRSCWPRHSHRRDDFQKAASSLDGVDATTNKLVIEQYPTLNVAKMESFKGQTPYDQQGAGQITRLKLIKTDPLPLVSVRVRGGDEVTFFIDTWGSEVGSIFQRSSGFQTSAMSREHFGGEQAKVGQSRIELLSATGRSTTSPS